MNHSVKMTIKNITHGLFCTLAFAACAIEDDIPYPIVEGSIQALEVEGQCDADGNSGTQTTIDRSGRTVSLYVDDTVDLGRLRITRLTVSNDATLIPDSAACNNFSRFPASGFESLESVPLSSDTRVNFSKAVTFTLRTYQDYVWTVSVSRILNREIMLENQIGRAMVDDVNRNVVVYVSKEQALDRIHVSSFSLGGAHGTVVPDPTASDTYDFSSPATFFVSNAWEESSYKWTVYVYRKDGDSSSTADAFAMSTRAILSGEIQNGKQPVIEYRKSDGSGWNTLPASSVTVKGIGFTATLSGLSPGTSYLYRVSTDGTAGNERSFTTVPATALTDGSFDTWHQDGKLWNPWAPGGTSFWDTGNRGATTISDSNSVPTDDTCDGNGKAALLESKYLVLKFAAGNIFTGSYLKTVGTNGVLSFGRPFGAFPSKLRINYKYTSAVIDKVGDDDYQYLKGRPDSCHIYIALTDWDAPREIRTRPSERQLFEKDDPHIIAYAELIKGEDTGRRNFRLNTVIQTVPRNTLWWWPAPANTVTSLPGGRAANCGLTISNWSMIKKRIHFLYW